MSFQIESLNASHTFTVRDNGVASLDVKYSEVVDQIIAAKKRGTFNEDFSVIDNVTDQIVLNNH